MNYGWRFVTSIGGCDQDHLQVEEMQKKAKWLPETLKIAEKKRKMAVWGGLTNRCEKKRSKKQRRKGKI